MGISEKQLDDLLFEVAPKVYDITGLDYDPTTLSVFYEQLDHDSIAQFDCGAGIILVNQSMQFHSLNDIYLTLGHEVAHKGQFEHTNHLEKLEHEAMDCGLTHILWRLVEGHAFYVECQLMKEYNPSYQRLGEVLLRFDNLYSANPTIENMSYAGGCSVIAEMVAHEGKEYVIDLYSQDLDHIVNLFSDESIFQKHMGR